ncbi:MAG: glycosyltransferase [Phycisphaerae bacterium]
MESPRIAYVITDMHTGGVPLHLLRLAVAMRERGYEPHVVSLAPPGAVSQRLRDEQIPTYACDADGPMDLRVFLRLARHLRRIAPGLVHSFLFHANVASRVAVPLSGHSPRKLITEIQTVETQRRWHLTVGGMTHRLGYCVVANSKAVLEHLHHRAHMARSRLRCIPGGVDLNRMRQAPPIDPESVGIRSGSSVLLWVGRLDPVKGLDELLDAFAEIAQETGAQLLIVGEGAYEQQVRRRITHNNLQHKVVMLGRRDDVPGLLRLADVFAFPSHTEGMPNALLEAMACGRPLVTTDVPGCRDIIAHEQTGLLVPPRDTEALASALKRLLLDRTLAEQLGRRAAEQVEAHHSFDQCVQRYASLYQEVSLAVP